MFRAFPDISTFMSRIAARAGLILPLAVMVVSTTSHAAMKNFTVAAAAGKGTHTNIQAAINDCESDDVCTINLVDATYTIAKPIWILGKANITIVGKTTSGARPKLVYDASMKTMVTNPLTGTKVQSKVRKVFTIPFYLNAAGKPCDVAVASCTTDPNRPAGWAMWPYKASTADGVALTSPDPGDKADQSNSYSSSGFQRNGMIVIEKSVDINIRNLALDGLQAMYFQNTGIWSQKYDVLFGTVGVNSMQSLRTSIQGCEVKNFFAGFYINGRNPGGTYGQANPDDLDLKNIVPLSRFGKAGDHLFEKNFVHDNWWFLYDEIEWDLGSTIRYNVAWNNINKSFQYKDSLKDVSCAAADCNSNEMNNQTGGFVYMKDVTLVTHKIYNNTIDQFGIILGFGGWRAGTQHLFYNNLLADPIDSLKNGNMTITYGGDWHQMLQYGGTTIFNNTFELEGGVKFTSETKKQAQIFSDTLPDPNDPTKFCTKGCWINKIEPVNVVTQIQPEFLWNNWGIAQGGTYQAYYTDAAGKRWGPFEIKESNMRDSTGLIVKMQSSAADSAIWKAHLNKYAFQIPFQSRDPLDPTFLMPEWGTNVVNKTVRHGGWAAAHRNADGSLVDRGAYCYDSLSGKTILGACGTQASLEVIDQKIVKIEATKEVKIPVQIKQIGAVFSDLKIDSIYYYPKLAWADSALNGKEANTNTNAVMQTPIKIAASAITTRNDSVFFNVPGLPAATVNFARFDVFASGVLPSSSERIASTPGIFIWRRNPVELALKVCEDQACTKPTATVGVGDTVFLDVQGQTSAGVKITTDITKLYLNPPAGVRIFDVVSNSVVDTAMFRAAVASGHGTFKVVFESRFKDILTAAGIAQDPVSKGYYGAVGQINLHVTSGKPWRAEWENPRSLESNLHACTDASDTANTMCDEIPQLIPFEGKIHLYDRFGNSVDGFNGTVNVSVVDPNGVTITYSATTAGTYAATAAVASTDSSAKVFIVGTPALAGILWPKTTAILVAQVAGVTDAPKDSTRVRIGKPSDRLAWKSPAVIDTFINTPMKMTLMVTKDGATPSTASAMANSKAFIGPIVTNRLSFFGDAAMTKPLGDSVALVAGTADIWVVSKTPFHPLWDSVVARMAGLADSALYPLGVRFRMPPKPPAPEPDFGTFLDNDCDGTPDSVFVKWAVGAGVQTTTLDTSKVKINQAVIYSTTDSLVLGTSALRILPGTAGGVAFALPSPSTSMFGRYNPTATIKIMATLIRTPAIDTVIQVGATVSVKDGISPRPVTATLIENASPATTPDELTVLFSEPMTYTGTKWPFQTMTAGLVNVPATGITVVSGVPGTAPNSIKFTLTGNTQGALAEKTILAILPGMGLTDAAGNDGRSACKTDTALVVLKTVAVEVVSSQILDKNGDGKADFVRLNFRREFRKASEHPDSVRVSDWKGITSVTISFASADSIGVSTWELPLPASFPVGATVGTGTDGAGSLDIYRGAIAQLNPPEHKSLIDSVAPIAVGVAKIEFGASGSDDKITVTYSEPMELVDANLDGMVLKTSGADVVLEFKNPASSDSGRVWTFTVNSGKLQVGDSIRLPGNRSMLRAANHGLPSTLGKAPYVPVVGGDRAPDSAMVLDLNGDGTGDAIRLYYKKAPVGNPTFSFTWGTRTVTVDSVTYKSAVAGNTDVTIAIDTLQTLKTSGTGSATSTSFISGSAVGALVFDLKDGIAAVIDAATVTYGQQEGEPDTLRIKLTEAVASLNLSENALVLANHLGVADLVHATTPSSMSMVYSKGSNEFLLVCQSTDCKLPGFGDYVRLAKGAATDLVGNTEGDSSHWAKVLTGPKPVRYIADIFPKPVIEFPAKDQNPLSTVAPVSIWIQKEGDATSWTAQGPTVSQWPKGTISTSDLNSGAMGLVGVKIDLNSSLDAQFLAYDNLGTFVGKADIKLDVEALKAANLTNSANKYSLLVGLNGLDAGNAQLASGVYMIRVITYSEQVVNGEKLRLMNQNKIFKVGVYNKLK